MTLTLEGTKKGALEFTQVLDQKTFCEHSGGEAQKQDIYSSLQQWQQSPGGWVKCQPAVCVCRHMDPVFLPSVELFPETAAGERLESIGSSPVIPL